MSTLNFKEIADRLSENNLTPDEIAHFRSFCAAWLFRLYETYGKLVSEGAGWQTDRRSSPDYKSQAERERAWYATEEGQEETTLKYRIRGVEAMQDVLTSLYYQANREMKLAGNDYGK